jgi:hypothetical protein
MAPRGPGVPRIPACHADAAEVLRFLDVPFSQVVAVDYDSVLYLTPKKEARTLWLHRDPQTLTLSHLVETGFQITRPACLPSCQTSPSSSDQ